MCTKAAASLAQAEQQQGSAGMLQRSSRGHWRVCPGSTHSMIQPLLPLLLLLPTTVAAYHCCCPPLLLPLFLHRQDRQGAQRRQGRGARLAACERVDGGAGGVGAVGRWVACAQQNTCPSESVTLPLRWQVGMGKLVRPARKGLTLQQTSPLPQ